MHPRKQSTTAYPINSLLILSMNHVDPATGLGNDLSSRKSEHWGKRLP